MGNKVNSNLVINIKRNDEIIANAIYKQLGIAYYAANLFDEVISCFDEIKENYLLDRDETEITDWKLFAISLLEYMDACLSDNAKEAAVRRWGDGEFGSSGHGKIEFETDGIKQNSEEFSVVVEMDIEAETVSFDGAIYVVDEEEAWYMATIDNPDIDEDEISDEDVADIIKEWCESLGEFNGDINEISFYEWENFFTMVDWCCGDGYFCMDKEIYRFYVVEE